MKSLLIILSFIGALCSHINSQCSTLIQMVDVMVEGCILPEVVSTSERLLPCFYPPEYNQLEEGDFAYIDYTETSCLSFCQLGTDVNITCLSLPVALANVEENKLIVFPNPVESFAFFRGDEINYLRLYTNCGILLAELQQPGINGIDMTSQTRGIYILQLFTKSKVYTRRIIKI